MEPHNINHQLPNNYYATSTSHQVCNSLPNLPPQASTHQNMDTHTPQSTHLTPYLEPNHCTQVSQRTLTNL